VAIKGSEDSLKAPCPSHLVLREHILKSLREHILKRRQPLEKTGSRALKGTCGNDLILGLEVVG
jgi:hypothetical protein